MSRKEENKQKQQPQVEEESDSEEQRELTEQEQEHARVRYSVGSAEENTKALILLSAVVVAVQLFLWFGLGVWRIAAFIVLPYYLAWTIATLAHYYLHRTSRRYEAAHTWLALGLVSLCACLVQASRLIAACLVDDEVGRWRYTTVGSPCALEIWFIALLTVAANLLMILFSVLIYRQYRVLKRDYPRQVELDAAVKALKSQ